MVDGAQFSLGVRCMKATCTAVGMEGCKKAVREPVATRKFDPGESSAIVELTQEMYASVKDFMESYFTAYLLLGGIHLGGLRQI